MCCGSQHLPGGCHLLFPPPAHGWLNYLTEPIIGLQRSSGQPPETKEESRRHRGCSNGTCQHPLSRWFLARSRSPPLSQGPPTKALPTRAPALNAIQEFSKWTDYKTKDQSLSAGDTLSALCSRMESLCLAVWQARPGLVLRSQCPLMLGESQLASSKQTASSQRTTGSSRLASASTEQNWGGGYAEASWQLFLRHAGHKCSLSWASPPRAQGSCRDPNPCRWGLWQGWPQGALDPGAKALSLGPEMGLGTASCSLAPGPFPLEMGLLGSR